MPRHARLRMVGVPFHIIQRGNNRSVCFYGDDDYQYYLQHLEIIARKQEVAIHAYVLMTNHVHLLMTAKKEEGVSQMMKQLGQRYVQYINKTYKRSGTLWEGRYRSSLVDADNYLLLCQRYIELNPVRADMVEHPGEYRWSRYCANAQDESNTLLTPHPLYEQLGNNKNQRCEHYRELFRYQVEPGIIDEIREATNSGYVLGREDFKEQIEAMLKRRVEKGKPGRPKKMKEVIIQNQQQQMEI